MLQKVCGVAARGGRKAPTPAALGAAAVQTRGYRHWPRCNPDDFGLPRHSMPLDIKDIMKDPNGRELDYLDNYWYWRVRKESTVLNPDRLAKVSLKQLAKDMGMELATPSVENMVGLLELYEYLKNACFIGPFGTIENPVLVPAVQDFRYVACTGGLGEDEHVPLWFRAQDGFLYRCGECDQVFMLARVHYDAEDARGGNAIDFKDPDVEDAFDLGLLENAHEMWNPKSEGMINWDVGAQAMGALNRPIDMLDYEAPENTKRMDLSSGEEGALASKDKKKIGA